MIVLLLVEMEKDGGGDEDEYALGEWVWRGGAGKEGEREKRRERVRTWPRAWGYRWFDYVVGVMSGSSRNKPSTKICGIWIFHTRTCKSPKFLNFFYWSTLRS